jgi:hypothetical protein
MVGFHGRPEGSSGKCKCKWRRGSRKGAPAVAVPSREPTCSAAPNAAEVLAELRREAGLRGRRAALAPETSLRRALILIESRRAGGACASPGQAQAPQQSRTSPLLRRPALGLSRSEPPLSSRVSPSPAVATFSAASGLPAPSTMYLTDTWRNSRQQLNFTTPQHPATRVVVCVLRLL